MKKYHVDKAFDDAKKGRASPGPGKYPCRSSFGNYGVSMGPKHTDLKPMTKVPGPGHYEYKCLSGQSAIKVESSVIKS